MKAFGITTKTHFLFVFIGKVCNFAAEKKFYDTMANTKGSMIRQKVLDKCLQSNRGYSIVEMMEKCNDALEERFLRSATAPNTIRQDLDEIANTYHVVIDVMRSGRNKRYRYKDRSFSIYKAPLSEKDLLVLRDVIEELNAFEGRPQFEWLQSTQFRIESVLVCGTMQSTPFVAFDENSELRGKQYFQPLFDAIKDKQTLALSYRSYKNEDVVEMIIHPYYLKEYNNRWFLLGYNDAWKDLTICALDRIIGIEYANAAYINNDGKYDFQTYFDNIVGVTKPKACTDEVEIRLWVSRQQYPYILSKPIHHTQQLVAEHEGGYEILIKLIPNFELEQLIISFANGVKVLSPTDFQARIKEKLQKTLDFYN